MKGTGEGDLRNGKHDGELEITFPSGRYYLVKLNRLVKTNDEGIVSGNIQWVHDLRQNKNTPGKTITIKGDLKNFDQKKKFIDVSYNIAADNGEGKNLNVDLKLVRQPKGERVEVQGLVRTSLTIPSGF